MATVDRRWGVVALCVAACSGGGGETASESATASESSASETGEAAARPNWHQDVAPLVTRACVGCHTAGGIAPFAMEGYAQTQPWATAMANSADAGAMPPWHALETDVCQPPLPYKHDPRLTDDEKATLRDWAELGAPEGDPALAEPLPEPQSLDLDAPTTTALMGSSVTVEAAGSTRDFFHCVSLDPGNDADVFLDGLQLIAGNRSILHHVLIYVDEGAESAAWPGGVKLDCGGGTGIAGTAPLIGAWIPGGLPMETPAGVGIRVPAGSRMILNVHYHATGSGPESDDGTGLALRWKESAPDYVSVFKLLGEPGAGDSLTGELMIPAGTKGHVEEYEWVVSDNGNPFPDSVDARLWAVAHHMHKVGVDMRVWIVDRDSGAETCALHTPEWDFNWQRVYEFDAGIGDAVRVKSGDTVRLRCEYDNTLDNPGVVEALAEVGLDQPIDVTQGEGTLDEMCTAAFGVAIRN
ncbi:MAG: hypothetical protein R3A79_02230 [Nannocystaceae bacterium]